MTTIRSCSFELGLKNKGVLTFQDVPLLQLLGGGPLAEASAVGKDSVSITALMTNTNMQIKYTGPKNCSAAHTLQSGLTKLLSSEKKKYSSLPSQVIQQFFMEAFNMYRAFHL